MLKISDITKFTLQDYPGNVACIVWFAGCNMRCRYCHNAELVRQEDGFLDEKAVFDFLEAKVNLLDGVVLSGGECTMAAELGDFIARIKNLGFRVRIDTNGLNTAVVRHLVDNYLIDSVALDFKAPKNKFTSVTQLDSALYDTFENTLKFLVANLLEKKIDLEIRTTVHTSLLDETDVNKIIEILDDLGYSEIFYIQNYTDTGGKILTNLGRQNWILKKEEIKKPEHFSVGYRNF
ncbi:MAG: anaerobic ribonucleoside-triphosphate reductase activating protein [Rickettsiales bacterium]|jgi:pyruvate formate lyase activating enzyme|nr:anaerobic ribonucleoside-triphosphate reductase activating protein [Rickettsiales bacterium]